MPTASDTPARPKPETAVGKTPAVPIRSLHDKALKSLSRRMAGYTQKEIKTIYEYDPDGARRIKSETVIRKQVGPDLAAITFALTNLDPQHWRAKPETGADASPTDWSDWSDEALREIAGTGTP